MTKLKACVVGIGGLAMVVGIVWMNFVFPEYEKVPDDFSSVSQYNGSYTVVDPIVARVQGNPAIQQLRSDSSALQAVADPRTQGFLAGPSLSMLLADEAVRGLLADPERLRQIIANPQALVQAVDPALIPILTDPAVVSMLGSPAIVALLADPAATELVLDPRTMGLLADPTALPLVSIPVTVRKERIATVRGSSSARLERRPYRTPGSRHPGSPRASSCWQ